MKKENTVIYLSDDNNKKHPYRVILTFISDEGKHYIVYTDDEIDEDGFIKTYAGIYEGNEEEEKLMPITSEEDFALIEKLLRRLEKEE